MGLFEGKKGLVLGIANNFSIAWAITQKLHEQGAEMAFNHLPDGERPKNEKKVRKLVEQDQVLFLFNTLGTPTNTAIHKYINLCSLELCLGFW